VVVSAPIVGEGGVYVFVFFDVRIEAHRGLSREKRTHVELGDVLAD
jgi:hypothetical protein